MRSAKSGASKAQSCAASNHSCSVSVRDVIHSGEPKPEFTTSLALPRKVRSSPPRSSEAIEVSETPAAASTRRPTATAIGHPIASPGRLRTRVRMRKYRAKPTSRSIIAPAR